MVFQGRSGPLAFCQFLECLRIRLSKRRQEHPGWEEGCLTFAKSGSVDTGAASCFFSAVMTALFTFQSEVDDGGVER